MTDGQAVIVTGASGGIGHAICERLRRDGLFVVGMDLQACTWVDRFVKVDLGQLDQVRDSAAEICGELSVTTIVHSAAVQPLAGAGDTGQDDFLETMRVNVLSVDSLVHAAKQSLVRSRGSVVVVSSVHAAATTAGINAYATSKAALEGWVRSAAIDLSPHVRVNAVRPGAIDTPKLHEGFDRWGAGAAEERRGILESRTPLRRIGRPDEVAAAVSFLASSEASFVTGSTLVVDGGAAACLGTE